MLPIELLPPVLAEKVWPLFLRGDHDVELFQAFKVVEVATRTPAEAARLIVFAAHLLDMVDQR
jgi:hypothetical protein